MINFKDTHWVWDRSKGRQGVAFLGTDFNTNADLAWFHANIPVALTPYFEELEIGLVPNLGGHVAITVEGNVVLLDMQWLKVIAEAAHWDALKEVLVHERQHVIQMLQGRLIADQASGAVYWEGQRYTVQEVNAQYPYLPWEDEAFTAQAEWLVEAGHYQCFDDALVVLHYNAENRQEAA